MKLLVELSGVMKQCGGRGSAAYKARDQSHEGRLAPRNVLWRLRDAPHRLPEVGADRGELRAKTSEHRPRGLRVDRDPSVSHAGLHGLPEHRNTVQHDAEDGGTYLASGNAEVGQEREGFPARPAQEPEYGDLVRAVGKDDVAAVVAVKVQTVTLVAGPASEAVRGNDDAGVGEVGLDPAGDRAYALNRLFVSAGPSRRWPSLVMLRGPSS